MQQQPYVVQQSQQPQYNMQQGPPQFVQAPPPQPQYVQQGQDATAYIQANVILPGTTSAAPALVRADQLDALRAQVCVCVRARARVCVHACMDCMRAPLCMYALPVTSC